MDVGSPQEDIVHTLLDVIDENLYLGSISAAIDIKILRKYMITHILTIETISLPRNILEIKNITTKSIQVLDNPRVDILSHFDDATAFIEEGLSKGVVLVHCYFGVSRSAAIIIAYIMKKHNLSYYEAYEKVKQKRKIINPNQGFVSQLKLYEDMGYTANETNMKFKMYKLAIAADKVRKIKSLPNDYFGLIKSDPGITQSQPEQNVYQCKKCRRILASELNLLTHQDNATNKQCIQIYFLEPLSWMNNITQSTQGKLYCPKCNNKIGAFNWIMGCQCPCGSQVTPAFYLIPSRVN